MGVREAKVEKHLKAEVTKLGGITRKWISPGHDGVTDQIVILKGAVYFVEVKTVDGVLESWQEREHKRLQKAGVQTYTVYGEFGVNCWIREVLLK